MSQQDDLRPSIDLLTSEMRKAVSSETGKVPLLSGVAIALMCEQLQRLAHTLHRIDGSLEALLKEVRRAQTMSGSIRVHDSARD